MVVLFLKIVACPNKAAFSSSPSVVWTGSETFCCANQLMYAFYFFVIKGDFGVQNVFTNQQKIKS